MNTSSVFLLAAGHVSLCFLMAIQINETKCTLMRVVYCEFSVQHSKIIMDLFFIGYFSQ